MSVTAVPIRPIAKGSVTRLWIGVALALAAGGGLAYAGTQSYVATTTSGFLAENGKQKGVVTTESGLQYRIIEEGAGASPTDADVVLVAYEGKLLDGTTFDKNEQAAMPVNGVVPGFSEALKLMKRGTKIELWIPPELGYGDKVPPDGPIPVNAVLNFDLTLLDFKSQAEIMEMQRQMQMQGGGAPMPGMPGGQ